MANPPQNERRELISLRLSPASLRAVDSLVAERVRNGDPVCRSEMLRRLLGIGLAELGGVRGGR